MSLSLFFLNADCRRWLGFGGSGGCEKRKRVKERKDLCIYKLDIKPPDKAEIGLFPRTDRRSSELREEMSPKRVFKQILISPLSVFLPIIKVKDPGTQAKFHPSNNVLNQITLSSSTF